VTNLALALLAPLLATAAWWWFTAPDDAPVQSAMPTGVAVQDDRSSAQDQSVLGTAVFATAGEAVAVSTGATKFARVGMRNADRALTAHAWSHNRRLTAERTFHLDGEQADAPLRLVLAPKPLPAASQAGPRPTK